MTRRRIRRLGRIGGHAQSAVLGQPIRLRNTSRHTCVHADKILCTLTPTNIVCQTDYDEGLLVFKWLQGVATGW
jgi:hypothetical protein